MEWLDTFLTLYTYWGILLLLLLCGFGMPVPEDLILITGGVLASGRPGAFAWTLLVCMVGVLAGDTIVFSLGHRYRDRILRAPPFKWIVTPRRLKQIRSLYRKYGYWAVFLTRFLAGLRVPSFLMAGMSQVPYRLFFLADGMAALLSVPLFVWLGYYFAEDIERVIHYVETVKTELVVAVVVIGILLLMRAVLWRPLRGWWIMRGGRSDRGDDPGPA